MTRIANISKTLCICINYFNQFGNFFSDPINLDDNDS